MCALVLDSADWLCLAPSSLADVQGGERGRGLQQQEWPSGVGHSALPRQLQPLLRLRAGGAVVSGHGLHQRRTGRDRPRIVSLSSQFFDVTVSEFRPLHCSLRKQNYVLTGEDSGGGGRHWGHPLSPPPPPASFFWKFLDLPLKLCHTAQIMGLLGKVVPWSLCKQGAIIPHLAGRRVIQNIRSDNGKWAGTQTK